jgi:HK97 gp10 family phage protein
VAEFSIDDAEIRRFERDVEVGTEEARKQVRNVVRKSTFETQARGRVRAPYKTGALTESISVDFIGSNRDVAQGETGPEVNYGWFVENGTERQAPQPYMGPAADEVEPTFYAALEAIDPMAGA